MRGVPLVLFVVLSSWLMACGPAFTEGPGGTEDGGLSAADPSDAVTTADADPPQTDGNDSDGGGTPGCHPTVYDATPTMYFDFPATGTAQKPGVTTCNLSNVLGPPDGKYAGLDAPANNDYEVIDVSSNGCTPGTDSCTYTEWDVSACVGLDYGKIMNLGSITVASRIELNACGDSPCNQEDASVCLQKPGQLVVFVAATKGLYTQSFGPASAIDGLVAVPDAPARYVVACRTADQEPTSEYADVGIDSIQVAACP